MAIDWVYFTKCVRSWVEEAARPLEPLWAKEWELFYSLTPEQQRLYNEIADLRHKLTEEGKFE